jgi:hypothetical protein
MDRRPFTIWRFRSVDGKQVVTVARHSEPMEHEHHYQQVLARVMAWSHKDALSTWVSAPAELAS